MNQQKDLAKSELMKAGVDAITASHLAIADESNDTFAKYIEISKSSIPHEMREAYQKAIEATKSYAEQASGIENIIVSADNKISIARLAISSVIRKRVYTLKGDIYFVNEAGESKKLCKIKNASFGAYLATILGSEIVGNKYSRIVKANDEVNLANYVLSEISRDEDNHLAQFRDFFIHDDKAYKGHFLQCEEYLRNIDKSSSIPRHTVNHGSYEAILHPELFAIRPKSLEAILDNLCNGDDSMKDYFCKLLASCYFDSKLTKNKIKTFVVISGVTGAGKSYLINLLTKVFSGSADNTMTMSANRLSNEFKQSELLNSRFLLTDGDMNGTQVSDQAMEFIKNASGADTITAQRKNQQEEVSGYLTSLIMLVSNHNFTTSDKSDAVDARLVPIHPKQKLNIPEDIFDLAENEDEIEAIANYLLAIFGKMSRKEIEIPSPNNRPDAVAKNKEMFAENNNSAIAFVHSIGEENIIGVPFTIVKQLYKEYCEDNGLPELKAKFNQTLSSRFNLDVIKGRVSNLDKVNVEACLDNISDYRAKSNFDEFESLLRLKELQEENFENLGVEAKKALRKTIRIIDKIQ